MKKNVLHAALFGLTFPLSLNAIGLGEMTIKSSLDQPFVAEIELIDVGSAPLIGIKVGVADPEYFERVGIEPLAVLSLLNFKIEKNEKGKLVIQVKSLERITEPYMELVVDLTWPSGQLYKAYTVFLDPPGYQLVSTRAQSSPTYYAKKVRKNTEPGVIEKTVITSIENNPVHDKLIDGKKQTTYGPTITNENVWQIAHRYKTSQLILPQVVLAIVGANPDAFKEGNLNGLQVGVRLIIPSTEDILQVPVELSTQEVMAHDNAWNEKTTINHVLMPPYTNGQETNAVPVISSNSQINYSEIPAIPKFTIQALLPAQGTAYKYISTNSSASVANTNQQQPIQNVTSPTLELDSTIKAEISITTAAVEAVRESNALLMEQLHLLQDQNKKLQSQLDKRDKEIALIQSKMKVLMKQRRAVASQANTSISTDHSSSIWPLLLLLALAAGGAFAYWYFKLREEEVNEELPLSNKSIEPKPFIAPVEPISQNSEGSTSLQSLALSKSNLTGENEFADQSSKVKNESVIAENKENDNSVSIESSKKTKNILDNADPALEPDLSEKIQEMSTSSEINMEKLQEEPAKEEPAKEEPAKEEPVKEEPVKEEPVKEEPVKEESVKEEPVKEELVKEEPVIDFKTETDLHYAPSTEESELLPEGQLDDTKTDETQPRHVQSTNDLLEFESGLDQLIPEVSDSKATKSKEESNEDTGLEFVSSLTEDQNIKQSIKAEEQEAEFNLDLESDDSSLNQEPEQAPDIELKNTEIDQAIADFFVEKDQEITIEETELSKESSIDAKVPAQVNDDTKNPLKSKTALNTLLDLAKTYVGMDDLESARSSLEEVIEHGSESQKIEAQKLLDELKDK